MFRHSFISYLPTGRLFSLALALFAINFSTTSAQQDTVNHWETIIYANDTWRYLVGTAEPDTNWRKLSFNDLSWAQGAGGIGYGDGDDNTVISNTISLYMRMNFNIIDTSKIEKAVLHVDYDDAFVAYINNVEVARSNIGVWGDNPPYNQTAASLREAQMYQGGNPQEFIISKQVLNNILNQGSNVLTMQVHNENFGSSDLSSIAFLSLGIDDVSFTYGSPPGWFIPPMGLTSSNLPIVVINTNNQPIVDDPRIVADMGIIYNGPGVRNYFTEPFNVYFGKISIEIRGSSSQMFPKKAYGLETQDAFGNNNNVSLLGMPIDNDWILYAPYSDKSLMRNVLTFKLGNATGHYAPRTRFCELLINDNYRGVYVLMEKIKRNPFRVNVAELTVNDTTGDKLTGGYIFKIDKFTGTGGDGWYSPFSPQPAIWKQIYFQYHYPKFDTILPVQKTYIENYVTAFETALDGPNFTDVQTGYPKYINIPSFIYYYLINEMSKNVDGYRLSAFFHKYRDSWVDGKLYAGPLWDFNLAFGNANYCGGGATDGWALDFNYICTGDNWQIPFWWEKLLQDSTFQNKIKCRWDDMRAGAFHTDTIMDYIDTVAAYLDESQQRNFQQWPILGSYVWPNNFIGNTYQEEINYLKSWTTDRLNWLDANITGTCWPWTGIAENEETFPVDVFPNPITEFSTLYFSLEKDASVNVAMYNVFGQEVLTPALRNYAAGSHSVSLKTDHIASGAYLLRITINERFVSSIKLIKH